MVNLQLHFIRKFPYPSDARNILVTKKFYFFAFTPAFTYDGKNVSRRKTHSSSFLNFCQTGIIYFIFKIPLISWSGAAVCEKSVESE